MEGGIFGGTQCFLFFWGFRREVLGRFSGGSGVPWGLMGRFLGTLGGSWGGILELKLIENAKES